VVLHELLTEREAVADDVRRTRRPHAVATKVRRRLGHVERHVVGASAAPADRIVIALRRPLNAALPGQRDQPGDRRTVTTMYEAGTRVPSASCCRAKAVKSCHAIARTPSNSDTASMSW